MVIDMKRACLFKLRLSADEKVFDPGRQFLLRDQMEVTHVDELADLNGGEDELCSR